MKRVFSGAGHIVLAVFTVAIVAFMAIMNYQTLGRVFPNDPMQQIWGMVLFTGGTLSWFAIFLLASRGFQRPIAMVMFAISLFGEVIYSAADVLMGGQSWVKVDDTLGTYVLYTFIGLTFAHGVALYIHFFTKPEVWAAIDIEAIEDDVKDKAQTRASELINTHVEGMADQLAARVANSVFANLRLPMPAVIDGVVLNESEPASDLRPAQAATDAAKKDGWFDGLFRKSARKDKVEPPISDDLFSMTNEDAEALVNMWRSNRARGVNIPDMFYPSTDTPAAPVVTSTAKSYTLDELLASMGMTADYARERIVNFGLDKDADRAFEMLNSYGFLPEKLTRENFRQLHSELFSKPLEPTPVVDAQFRGPATQNPA